MTRLSISIEKIRDQFPILKQKVYDKPLVYLDNAATTQKPMQVVEAIANYYYTYNSNINRSINMLATRSTNEVEQSRRATQQLINAKLPQEIIFTANATESINLIASTYGQQNINQGDNIVLSEAEHHSNIVPWQTLAKNKKATLHYIPVLQNGDLNTSTLQQIINHKTKIISISHVSNAIGNLNPIKEIIHTAHTHNAIAIIDAAQSIAYTPIDVQELDCDFLVFSSHKMYGPTGVGLLYGKKLLLDQMPPYKTGGSMVKQVTKQTTTYQDPPYKFEAGTPNIAGIIGHNEAINFIQNIGVNNIYHHITEIREHAHATLSTINKLNILNPLNTKSSIISFNIHQANPMDISLLLDANGIAVRAGTHCAQPLMNALHHEHGTIRASFAIYNQKSEIDYLAHTLKEIISKQCT
jgi:cysteine desulfurase/selenocysteine lyase